MLIFSKEALMMKKTPERVTLRPKMS